MPNQPPPGEHPEGTTQVAEALPTKTTSVGDTRLSRAQIAIRGLGASKVSGDLVAAELPEGGVRITGTLVGLAPGKHGFHVHEHGDCSAADGSSAGGHFKAAGEQHAEINAPHSHLGDLGNLQADASGRAVIDVTRKGATLSQDSKSFIGRSIIVHEKHDDVTTQPTGDSGGRIACGVVQKI